MARLGVINKARSFNDDDDIIICRAAKQRNSRRTYGASGYCIHLQHEMKQATRHEQEMLRPSD